MSFIFSTSLEPLSSSLITLISRCEGCFFFFSPLRFEVVVRSSQVLRLQFFPHSRSFQRFNRTAGRRKRRGENKRKCDALELQTDDGVIGEQLSTSRSEQRVGRSAGPRQQPAPAGCHLKSEIKRRFGWTVEADEINEAESV